MFSYDSKILSDLIWDDYVALKQENLDLRAKLKVASTVIDTFTSTLNVNITESGIGGVG